MFLEEREKQRAASVPKATRASQATPAAGTEPAKKPAAFDLIPDSLRYALEDAGVTGIPQHLVPDLSGNLTLAQLKKAEDFYLGLSPARAERATSRH